MVRIDADATTHWPDEEIARRWLQIFTGPLFIHRYLAGVKLTSGELKCVADQLATWRERLADLSWFMRCLNEPIARMANAEDHCTGHSNLTEKHEKLTQKTASVLVRFMKKGFYSA